MAHSLYSTQVKTLSAFMMRQLRDIMSVEWYDKITNETILRRSNMACTADILIVRNLRWLGPVHRMDNDRLPKLYSQLKDGKRNHGNT